MTEARRILVIRLGAFGDFAQSFPAFAAIRAHHRGARITLLTTRPFVDLARASPWFDEVWSDGRPPWRRVGEVLRLARRLRGGRFDRVYDLQTSRRSSLYRLAVGRAAEWSGIARGASHRHDTPTRQSVSTVPRQQEQLRIAGIADVPAPDLGWLTEGAAALDLPERFCLLIPGASARWPEKRWPVEGFAALASALAIPCVVVGGPAEAPLAAAIKAAAPATLDWCGDRSPPAILAALAHRSAFAVGNDTGPTHLVSVVGCPTLALFGARSDPARHAPPGPAVKVLAVPMLESLPAAEVLAALAAFLPREAVAAALPAGAGTL
ncbi:glycosyltransferase family 9 protein [Roseomonas sp. HF4]|uniref:glycosyltransferase family 9 protein n=1 Tax=Roseomonas sp. HF4 TaxID=2562313 RepID=UPI0010C04828|nr:glycosyltransferase family 9 protein [Roseomonas sp. HF4]